MTYDPNKIVQIIPAPQHWKSVYLSSDKEKIHMPIVCIALTADGDVILLDMDGSGYIEPVTSYQVIYDEL
ncbi:hypothetical protein SporoP32a_07355 [Sporosarcina ureae]|nr:hypothetical protein SporoP32a_07355 [Sporosarcina ureae]